MKAAAAVDETGKNGVAAVGAVVEIVDAAIEVEGVETLTTTTVIDVEATMGIKTATLTEAEAAGVPAGTMTTTAEEGRVAITTGTIMDPEEGDKAMAMADLLCSLMVDIMQDRHPLVRMECLPFHLQRLLPQ